MKGMNIPEEKVLPDWLTEEGGGVSNVSLSFKGTGLLRQGQLELWFFISVLF